MVDRLEELLEMMETEDEDEEREDALALTDRTVPGLVSPEGDDGDANPSGDARTDQGVPLAAENQAPGGEGLSGDKPAEDADAPAEDVWRWKLVETPGEAVAEAVRMAGKSRPENSGMHRSVEQGGEPAQTAARGAQSGLEELYRRTAQASRPPVQGLPVEQAGRTHQAEEPGRAAALTVDELDRAVRRDSRRYDGGITIY